MPSHARIKTFTQSNVLTRAGDCTYSLYQQIPSSFIATADYLYLT